MEESLGMVMIFTIISTSIEWLGNKWEDIQFREREAIRLKKELSDAEEKVLMTSFTLWTVKRYRRV